VALRQTPKDQYAESRPCDFATSRALRLTDGRKGTSITCPSTGRPGSSAYSCGSQTLSLVPSGFMATGTHPSAMFAASSGENQGEVMYPTGSFPSSWEISQKSGA